MFLFFQAYVALGLEKYDHLTAELSRAAGRLQMISVQKALLLRASFSVSKVLHLNSVLRLSFLQCSDLSFIPGQPVFPSVL